MKKILIKYDINTLPIDLRKYFENCDIYDSSCYSGALVLYSTNGYYLKIDKKDKLKTEAEMVKLFNSLKIGVELVEYISIDKDYLLTKKANGEDLTSLINEPELLCNIVAESLHKLHSIKISNIPLSRSLKNYQDGIISDYNTVDFDRNSLLDLFGIHTKEEALNIINNSNIKLDATTLIHGDSCLPNMIYNNDKFECFIDLETAGLGDKHIDLYFAIWSIQYNLKTNKYNNYFLDCYGRGNIDFEKLRYIAALELFM